MHSIRMFDRFFHHFPGLRGKALTQIKLLLGQGLTPKELALAISIGAAIGLCPLYGSATIIAAGTALLFRFNMVAIQSSNYAVFPLQVLMIPVFVRTGEFILGAAPLPFSAEGIMEMWKGGLLNFAGGMGMALVHATMAWAVISPVIAGAFYFILVPLLNRFTDRNNFKKKTG